MKCFQKILEQIALEDGTTPEEVQRQMQLAIDTAFENPSEETKSVQDMLTCQGNRPTPEELVTQIAMMLRDHGPFYNSQSSPWQ